MDIAKRLKPIEAATYFIDQHFPNCQGALLAGSVVRGEETDTSDLDIIVLDNSISSSYRESLIKYGWPIEVFVHSISSYKQFFEMDYRRAKPSMQRMIAEGIILKDDGVISPIKEEAKLVLDKGPEEWSEETIRVKQYFITDVLDDFIGCHDRAEGIFIANTLSNLIHEFVLRTNRMWIGTSKWIVRALKHYDEGFTNDFVEAFDMYYQTGEKDRVIQLSQKVLEPYGGPLFDGFSIGKAE
ncbi:nucleotidyltransferase domain-containing protein [Bacillus sp. FJAT-49736]|uniref:nucleotidyltransferase domain-containing protein n=1 Tax=Bacillus sp. FJAT-49736 TaxID=2833582 RepID=UPI001BC9A2A2|nr:nucleotidyltransferase domain-containing protein [Bacillus sp. FJAT-49736]MBS4174805.1 nucleotidyltransferase domain-containing protein [Bacillus sp. FJAT-49736]MBS4175538.1 nucleotidyltransferase domain-containing protein [Bacillus sp. FJAT-49736]